MLSKVVSVAENGNHELACGHTVWLSPIAADGAAATGEAECPEPHASEPAPEPAPPKPQPPPCEFDERLAPGTIDVCGVNAAGEEVVYVRLASGHLPPITRIRLSPPLEG